MKWSGNRYVIAFFLGTLFNVRIAIFPSYERSTEPSFARYYTNHNQMTPSTNSLL